jgi:hypothetical protein
LSLEVSLNSRLVQSTISITVRIAGTDDEQHEYEYLGAWGPRFDKLADMYGPAEESEEED